MQEDPNNAEPLDHSAVPKVRNAVKQTDINTTELDATGDITSVDRGKNSGPVAIGNIVGFIEVVSVAPTSKPRNFSQQFKIYVNGGTVRFYFYDYKAHAWNFK